METTTALPKIISVDDHTVEPSDVWQNRLPKKYLDTGPRVVRAPLKEISFLGGRFKPVMGAPGSDGPLGDWWVYEDLHRPLTRLDTAVGYDRDEIRLEVITYEQMRPGSHSVPDRLADMDVNHVQSALCFPTFPRFCGQTFTEASDRELGLLCVRAYNDWMVEEPMCMAMTVPVSSQARKKGSQWSVWTEGRPRCGGISEKATARTPRAALRRTSAAASSGSHSGIRVSGMSRPRASGPHHSSTIQSL